MFPTSLDGKYDFPFVHGISAVLAFVCIAVVILWYSDLTLQELEKADAAAYKRYKIYYRGIGIFMVAAIGVSVFLHYAVKKEDSFILLAEACGIWAFAAYWFVKNKEMHLVSRFLEKQGMVRPSSAATQNEVAKAV